MNCESCSEHKPDPVSFQVHETDMARLSCANARLGKAVVCLAVVCVALVIALFFANRSSERALLENNRRWIEMWEQYDFESYEYQQDGEGVNIIGDRNGVDYYGADRESPEANPEG